MSDLRARTIVSMDFLRSRHLSFGGVDSLLIMSALPGIFIARLIRCLAHAAGSYERKAAKRTRCSKAETVASQIFCNRVYDVCCSLRDQNTNPIRVPEMSQLSLEPQQKCTLNIEYVSKQVPICLERALRRDSSQFRCDPFIRKLCKDKLY
jgi:hypothetical protein